MKENNFRSLPILSQSGTMYRGNIYRQHIYKRLLNGESLDVSVTHHLKNATKYIYTNSTLFQTILTLGESQKTDSGYRLPHGRDFGLMEPIPLHLVGGLCTAPGIGPRAGPGAELPLPFAGVHIPGLFSS